MCTVDNYLVAATSVLETPEIKVQIAVADLRSTRWHSTYSPQSTPPPASAQATSSQTASGVLPKAILLNPTLLKHTLLKPPIIPSSSSRPSSSPPLSSSIHPSSVLSDLLEAGCQLRTLSQHYRSISAASTLPSYKLIRSNLVVSNYSRYSLEDTEPCYGK
jgi:hypothetical protein